jgi:ABC-type multidrug transport system fused ATPase/permease subunit
MKSKEQQDSEKEKQRISKAGFKKSLRVFRYIKPYGASFFTGIVLLSVSGLLVITITALLGLLMSPGDIHTVPGGDTTKWVLQGIMSDLDFSSSEGVLAALVFLLLIQGVFSFIRVYMFAYVTENAMLELRSDAFKKMIGKSMDFYHTSRVGDLVTRISSDITTVQETLTMTLAEFIRQTVIIVFGVGCLVAFSLELTLVMLCSLPVIIVVMVVFGKFIRRLGKETQDKVADSGNIVNEALMGIVNVKSYANEWWEWKRFKSSAEKVKAFGMRGAIWRGMFGTFIIIFLFGALGLVIGWGAHLNQKGELPKEVLPQFIMLTGLVAGSIGGLASQLGSLQRGIGVIETIMELIDSPDEGVDYEPHQNGISIQPSIEFRNVSFSYPTRPDVQVLQDLSFTIPEGSKLAIVGQSGSGKSTIAALVLRFFEPTTGTIFWSNKNAAEYSKSQIRSQIAFVPQEVILFGGTIKENILYGNPNADDKALKQVVNDANIAEFVKVFPEGLETLVGERGVQLSGGQRQRIAIARAMIRNPRLLILDEATSALDSNSERQVQDALNKLMEGRTSIVIAHRLSTIQDCDQILVLDKGKILEKGSHDFLLGKDKSVYAQMLSMQNFTHAQDEAKN